MSEVTTLAPVEVWKRCVRAAMNGEVTAQTAFYHEDGVLEFPFLLADGVPNRFEGREAIGRVFATLQAKVERIGTSVDEETSSLVVHETTDPEVIIAEIELSVEVGGVSRASRYIQVVRVRDGKIASMRDYFAGGVDGIVTDALSE
ncbi:MAG TPA: nuclear transport factor 2 family protein [Stackebrandtia sp.]|uniref:nuclear transport factor 2 family protein n=1 Tax=Stackebrandtia sp. TaxID=2023065 RepID=UPI002D47A090|nr:nuclear transport factor 2 family protein [Stackebrandtia sp.]HZE37792.1 nuclear transport factor 2 family protein [Stackebrandtia sp.]